MVGDNLEVKKKCLPLQSQNERGVPEKVQKFLKRLALKKVEKFLQKSLEIKK